MSDSCGMCFHPKIRHRGARCYTTGDGVKEPVVCCCNLTFDPQPAIIQGLMDPAVFVPAGPGSISLSSRPSLQGALPFAGHPRFHELLSEMATTHAAKASDYSSATDVLSNLRSSEDVGVEAWRGALVRLLDKVNRLKNLARKSARGEGPAVVNESMDDTLMDLAACALLVRMLREGK